MLLPHQHQTARVSPFVILWAAQLSTLGRAAPGRAAVRMLHSRAWEEGRLIKLILKAWRKPDVWFPLHENVLIMVKKVTICYCRVLITVEYCYWCDTGAQLNKSQE